MYCACGSSYHGAEAEAERSCARCIPPNFTLILGSQLHGQLFAYLPKVILGGIFSLGPFVIYVLYIYSWNGIFFKK